MLRRWSLGKIGSFNIIASLSLSSVSVAVFAHNCFCIVSSLNSLACLIFVLLLSMLGASFAAALLAKDTKNQGADLVDSSSGKTLGMQSSAERFKGDEDAEPTCMMGRSNSNNGKRMCSTSSLAKINLAHGKMIVEDCDKEGTVHLIHLFDNNCEMHHALCVSSFEEYPIIPIYFCASSSSVFPCSLSCIIAACSRGIWCHFWHQWRVSHCDYPISERFHCHQAEQRRHVLQD